MKKRVWLPVLMTALLSIAVVFIGCNKNIPAPTPEAAVVRLDASSLLLDVYETQQLTATVTGTEAAVIWSSSDGEVATVQDGLVTAVSEGEATVTARAGDARAVCVVTVYNSNTAPVLQIDRNSVYVEKGKSQSVTVQTLWKGNPIDETVDYTWQADNDYSGIVSIAKNGDTFEFTGIEYGTVDLAVSATVRGVLLVGNIRVRVYNADIAFEVEGLTAVEGGYAADLAKLAYNGHVTEKSFTVAVTDKGTPVADAAIDWKIEDPDVVTLSNGKLTAGNEGSTTVIGTYQNNDVVIYVTTYRTPIAIEAVYLETYKLAPKVKGVPTANGQSDTLTFQTEFTGTVTSVMLGGVDIFESYDGANKTLKIMTDLLPTDTNKMGKVEFAVNTDLAVYTPIDAQVVTMAIRNAADFNKMGEVAANQTVDWTLDKNGESKPYHWDGYFVLANDIEYTGEYMSFCSWATLGDIGVHNPDAKTEGWHSGKANGFQGIFDGNGHTVTGLKLKDDDKNLASGIFGILAQGSVIRNVSFVDFEHTIGSGYLCNSGIGTIENVYLRCDKQSGGKENDNKNGLLYARDVEVGAVVKNVFIDTVLASDTDNYAIGSVREGYGIFKGVYAVGSTHAARPLTEGHGTKNVLGAYQTYAELAAADIEFSGWENDFWCIVNGFPYPKNLQFPDVSTEATYGAFMPMGGKCAVAIDKRAVITLDDDAIAAGVTLDGSVIVAPATLATGNAIGFTVKSAFGGEMRNYSVTIARNETAEVTDRQRVVAIGTGETTFTLDLSSLKNVFDTDTEVYMVSLDGTIFTNISWVPASQALILEKATLSKHWGERDVTVVFAHKSGTTYDVFITVTVPVKIVTQVITTQQEFENWNKVASEVAGGGAGQYAGYFELGGNIDYGGEVYPTFWNWVEGRDDWQNADKYGFSGTFDGCGYAVKNLQLAGDNGSIFGLLKKGSVVENIAFTDYKGGNGSAGLCVTSKGTFENVYIECTSHAGGINADRFGSFFGMWSSYPEAQVRHCLVDVKFDGADDLQNMLAIGKVYEGAGSLDGVYVIGMTRNLVEITETLGGVKNVYGGYADYAAFIDANIDFSAWGADFWTTPTGGIPYPNRLSQKVSITNSETTLGAGTELQISGNGTRRIYAVDEEAKGAGVTISATGMLTIPENVKGITKVTVTVGTYNDPSDKATKEFRIVTTTKITVSGRQDVYYYHGDDDLTFEIDLSAYEGQIQGTLASVSIDGAMFATKGYTWDKKLKLDRDTLLTHYGEQDIVAQFNQYETDGETVIGTTIVTVPVLSITWIIGNQWAFKDWGTVANKVAGNAPGQYAGYFVLGNDFTYNASAAGDYPAFWSWAKADACGLSANWQDADKYGFSGTFDGRGHTVDGLKLEGWNNATIFGLLKEGSVIKNIAFTNFTGDQEAAGLCLASCGTIENIYIECTSHGGGSTAEKFGSFFGMWKSFEKGRIRHCLVDVKFNGANGLKDMLAIGKVSAGNLDGVYVIGMTENLVDGDTANNIYGGYADTAAFKAAALDFTDWDTDFWQIIDGVPTKK